jgi:hypothetical protein
MALYSEPDFVADLAGRLLAQVVSYFDPIANPGSNAPPARQIVAGLEPAWDADQIAVWSNLVHPTRLIPMRGGASSRLTMTAAEGGPQERIGSVLTIGFTIDVLRTYPQIGQSGPIVYGVDVAAPADLTAYGKAILTDLWTVQHGLTQDQHANSMFGVPSPIAVPDSVIMPVKPLGPKGDLAGWRFSLMIAGA